MSVPRIKGKIFQVSEEETENAQKWGFEIFLTDIGQTVELESMGCFGFFDTEALAKEELMIAVKVCCGAVDSVNETYIDMRLGGLTRRWDKTDEN